MISVDQGEFRLSTHTTGYWFRVTPFGHLEHVYYGARLPEDQPMEPLALKHTVPVGCSVTYDESDPTYCLDTLPLEWSGIGKGDYRDPPAEIRMPDGTFTADFRYRSHQIIDGCAPLEKLPTARDATGTCQTLKVILADESNQVTIDLYYTVFEQTDVITRRAVLTNRNEKPLTLRRMLSLMVDLPNDGFRLITFDGGWISEGNRHEHVLGPGVWVNGSRTGDSSNRHNPGFLLAAQGAREGTGNVYGFNLIYSGNHYGAVELTARELVRVSLGIHPHCFEWTLHTGECFETPEAVMSYSPDGFNGLSAHFHDFVNRHVVRGEWQGKERPILFNSWEACFFRLTRGKLLRLARKAKRLGVELFVLDDGWFAGRDDDTAGLGDYAVHRRKLPRGLPELSRQIHRMGMQFGLWFEPEMVNPNSELYRAHPECALVTPGKTPAMGRHQLVLDLCNPAVRDYIVDHVSHILDTCGVDYVKWDDNRHISDACSPCLTDQGEFLHRYLLGLYEVLGRIFGPRPHILLESCSSGGNRFDLGMLCYSPQIWASDNTDPVERLRIQGGLSCLYPPSAMGAHVSEAPHQQTLRDTPLSTRFHVAAFGCLGYELELKNLSHVERREIRRQIAFYREHRKLLQYGRFLRGEDERPNQTVWHCVDEDACQGVSGFFQTRAEPGAPFDRLRLAGLCPTCRYRVSALPQSVSIRRFGGLIRHLLPVSFKPDGAVLRWVNRLYSLPDGIDAFTAYGSALMSGVQLQNQFIGTGYDARIRMWGDYGSTLYVVESLEDAAPRSKVFKPQKNQAAPTADHSACA